MITGILALIIIYIRLISFSLTVQTAEYSQQEQTPRVHLTLKAKTGHPTMYLPGLRNQRKLRALIKKNVKITHCKTKKMQNCATGGGFPRSDPESPFVTVCPPLWRPLPFQGTSYRVMVTSDHISEGCYLEPDLHIIKVKIRW